MTLENHIASMPLDELREHVARFFFLKNCIVQAETHRVREHYIYLPMFYNNDIVESIDYLMGKKGVNPTCEQWLAEHGLFGRGTK